MRFPRLVCPNNLDLFHSFAGHSLAVKVDDLAHMAEAAANVRASENDVFCVIFESNVPLSDIELPDGHEDIPLAVMAPSFGKFRDLAGRAGALRNGNIRVYLPCDEPENLIGLRILSSIGVHSCAVPGTESIDWEALADLMTYAVLERVPHASIEPFAYIASNYDPASRLEFGAIFFDDPRHFLHLDGKGRVALSHAELVEEAFIAGDISEIEAPLDFPAIKQRTEAWKKYFVDGHACASCAAWRICLGRFSDHLSENPGCSEFFSELAEVAGQYQALRVPAEERVVWQP